MLVKLSIVLLVALLASTGLACYNLARPPNQPYKCADGTWVENGHHCNGHADCLDFSDECTCDHIGCAPGGFKCIADGHCLSKWQRCDGVRDCTDFSDECGCPPKWKPEQRECPPGHYNCLYGLCIPESKLCNGNPDCWEWDHSDECNCGHVGCPPGQFKCTSMYRNKVACAPLRSRCDGKQDCHDLSDECGCPYRGKRLVNVTKRQGQFRYNYEPSFLYSNAMYTKDKEIKWYSFEFEYKYVVRQKTFFLIPIRDECKT